MAWYRMRSIGSGGGVTPIGDATDGDVKAGKTYMNANGASTGTMTDNGAVSKTLNTTTTSYTVPEGYHNGSGTVSITTQTKSCTPTTSSQTITPDSGKVLSSVSVGTQVHTETKSITAGTSTASTDLTATHNYRYISVAPTPSQEKTVTSSRSNQTVTPDSGKLLSKVTVSGLAPTGTYPASSRGASLDMGATSNYRYVNTNNVPNSNSGTKTISSSDTNWYTGNVDMGATNTYRYVNAVAVYNKGVSDGGSSTIGSFTLQGSTLKTISCGGKPKRVCLIWQNASVYDGYDILYNESVSSTVYAVEWAGGQAVVTLGQYTGTIMFNITSTGFQFRADNGTGTLGTVYYFAVNK